MNYEDLARIPLKPLILADPTRWGFNEPRFVTHEQRLGYIYGGAQEIEHLASLYNFLADATPLAIVVGDRTDDGLYPIYTGRRYSISHALCTFLAQLHASPTSPAEEKEV
jgi:hypothetical protein